MSDLERMREWLATFPGTDERPNAPNSFTIDHVSEDPFSTGLHSNGSLEIGRQSDLGGNIILTQQYNFSYSAVMEKDANLDDVSTNNAEWVMAFQQWVTDQVMSGESPKFGNIDTDNEIIRAQNGSFVQRVSDGVGMYMTTITAIFKKHYKSGGNKWQVHK